MNIDLPTTLEVDGIEHPIRSDFRDALECFSTINDEELTESERSFCVLFILFKDFSKIQNYAKAIEKASWFLSAGISHNKELPKLMDWEQDFDLIVPAVNRVLGYECRSVEYLHWWTFTGAYMEMGEGRFHSVVSIRSKMRKGKKLEDFEQEYYRENRDVIDLKSQFSQKKDDFYDEFGV